MSFTSWVYDLSKARSRHGLYEFLESEFDLIRSHARVLSIGAGGKVNDLLNHYATKKNFSVVSFDIDVKRKPDLVGDICTYDFGHTRFDVVVISEVLEHLHSPHLGVRNIYEILNENGRLILSTPFILPIHEDPYDYYRFTKYGLEFLLKEFKNVQIRQRNSYFEAIDVLYMRLLQEKTKSSYYLAHFLIPAVYFIKRPITKLLDACIQTNGMTTGYVVTASK